MRVAILLVLLALSATAPVATAETQEHPPFEGIQTGPVPTICYTTEPEPRVWIADACY